MEAERRVGMSQMRTDIEVIKTKSDFMAKTLQEIVLEMKLVKETLANTESLKKSDLDAHVVQDRWLFGLVIGLLVCIFGKLIHG